VHLPREIKWNANLIQQGNFIDLFLARRFFGYKRPSSGALDVELQHMVFCTEFLDGCWSWEPLRSSCVRCGWCTSMSKNSVQKTIRCNSTPNASDDGRMYPKTSRAKNTSIKLPCCTKLIFHIITSITSMLSVSFQFSPSKPCTLPRMYHVLLLSTSVYWNTSIATSEHTRLHHRSNRTCIRGVTAGT